MTDVLHFKLRGPFRIIAGDGAELTPPLAKAQGLLLLLLTAADGRRGRAWVQDKLWSDRGQEQAAASLRQALSVIRKSLGRYRSLLHADRRILSLDMEQVIIDEGDDADFAEGLDIRDPEFDSWLVKERAKRASPERQADNAPPWRASVEQGRLRPETIGLSCRSDGSEVAAWTSHVLADGLFLGLKESSHLDVLREGETSIGIAGNCDLELEVGSVLAGTNGISIRMSVIEGRTRRQIWSGHCTTSLRGGPPVEDFDVLRLSNCALEAVAFDRGRLSGDVERDQADELLRLAINKVFSMKPEEVAAADKLLEMANDMRPSPIYLAWRLQLRTIQRLERHTQDEQRLREEGQALAAHVLETGSENSMVLALVANANLFLFRDSAASLHFGRSSMERNPANPMAAWSLSSAKLYNGDAKGAYYDAVRGRRMAMRSSRRFFWDLQQAAAAMVLGRRDEAVGLLEGITLDRPGFRPPLRYLLALDATSGREASASDYVARLKSLEPDFSTPRLFQDPNYPASLVHRTNLIEPDRVLTLN